ncbi:MAG: YqaA family protein [Mariprofundaceae bacterium]|nr:YqaA family protein [Mariprofundaceae bacterium]
MPAPIELITLFFSALVSATLFPGGSELLLLYDIQQGSSKIGCIGIATVGNVMGSTITYAMGYYGKKTMQASRYRMPACLQVSPKRQQQAEVYFQRFGGIALLFAWLPVVGDPLCFVAGLLRFHWCWFVALVLLGKLGRYSAIVWLGSF